MPAAYLSFFSAIAQASATLVGLLFVALSIDVGLEHEYRAKQFALTETAFISLGGIFVISLLALLPGDARALPIGGLVLAVVGIADLVRIQRIVEHIHYPRDLWYIFITIAAYICLGASSYWMLHTSISDGLLGLFCIILVLLAGLSLARAWRALLITKRRPS